MPKSFKAYVETPGISFFLSGCPREKVSPWQHVGPLLSLFWVLARLAARQEVAWLPAQ